VIRAFQTFPNQSVVVNLTIDSEGNALVRIGKWLRSTLYADNAETLMSKH
jgi:hypothetical protein